MEVERIELSSLETLSKGYFYVRSTFILVRKKPSMKGATGKAFSTCDILSSISTSQVV